MAAEINYDESGKPKSVVLTYEEYQFLLRRPDEQTIIEQTVIKNTEPIMQFARSETDSAAPEPEVTDRPPPEDYQPRDAPESPVTQASPPDVRRYKNATGYYDSYGFRVLKGSKASGHPSNTFNRMDRAVRLRKQLIEWGILARDEEWHDYTFTEDYSFSSSSAAASIVDGNSRSGPKAWGNRRL